jgi:hypothetical protein
MNKEKEILIIIADYINKSEFNEADLLEDIIFIDCGDATILLEDDRIGLSFDVNCEQSAVARITKLIVEATINIATHHVEIYEPYLDIFDDNDEVIDTLFGEEAKQYNYRKIMELAGSYISRLN